MAILFLKINSIYKKIENEKNILEIIEKNNQKKINLENNTTGQIKNYINNENTNSSSWISNKNKKEKFPKINFKLNEIAKWPSSTNISCWFCTRNFSNPPIGIPTKYDDKIFHIKGCFCSFKCANSWIFYFENLNFKWEYESLLNLLYIKMGNCGTIGYSPPKETMVKFGGDLSEEEYSKLLKCKITINILNIHMVSLNTSFNISSILEEKGNIVDKINNSEIFYNNNIITIKNKKKISRTKCKK